MDGFKQRIIGALVLVCLAVIFVPMLFEKPNNKSATQSIQIPTEPQSQSITIEKPKAPAATPGNQASSGVMSAAPATSSAQSGMAEMSGGAGAQAAASEPGTQAAPTQAAPNPAAAKPATTEQSATSQAQQASEHKSAAKKTPAKPQGKWVVQLGSFGEEKNADSLRNKVRAKGFAAYLEQAQAGGRKLTRVFAGPFVEKSDAVAAKRALDRDFGIKSLVMTNEQHK